MKYLALLIVLVIGGLAYVRFEQPQTWNDYLDVVDTTLKAPSAPDATNSAPVEPAPQVAAKPTAPEIISPDSTNYINPDHVHTVQQPDQPSASTNAPALNAPTTDNTNAPASAAPTQSITISPDSTNYINPNHVKSVSQPGEVPADNPTSSQ
jgi:hypothetical protein